MKSKIIVLLVLILFSSCSNSEKKSNPILIATAANMQFAMDELTKTFTLQTGIKCHTSISSSGKLTAQIKEGAPFDIFVSADMKFPNELHKTGFTVSKPEIYAYGKLIMWTMDNEILPSFELLLDKNIKHIAIANPKTAPYGVAAEEVLKKKKLHNNLKSKFVYGESIAQTNQFITTQAAEIGFTSKSVVFSKQMKGKGNWIEIDDNSYTPISQGIVILKNGKHQINEVQKFYNFLFSEKGKEILNKFGYSAI